MEKFKFLSKTKMAKIPKNAGVYCFKGGRKFLYMGKAANIRERVKNHFQQPAYRDNLFINQVSKIGYLKTDSEIEALILEANLIKKYQPKYNVVWRDDKNYFFVGITKEDFPRVFWTHQAKKSKIGNWKLKIKYIGPFVDGKALKQTLKVLRKVFPYRTCKTLPKRPCLWYHLNRCLAPCLLKSDQSSLLWSRRFSAKVQEMIKKTSHRNAKNLIKILRQGKNPTLKQLKEEMKKVAESQGFETAAKIRDQIEALKRITSHAQILEPSEAISPIQPWLIGKIWKKIEKNLQKILNTKKKTSRIEAYDISNIQGQEATGSMVTFINGRPDKNFYRKFKIKITGKPNDIAMIKEMLERRLNHREWPYPDLILVDGGKAQLTALLKILNKCLMSDLKKIKGMALAKKDNELYIEGQKAPISLDSLSNSLKLMILQWRDEAHRFAKKYHHKLREIDLLPKS